MKQNKIDSLLGLAARSRNLVSGEFMTEKVIKNGRAHLVIVGTDASDNTKKRFHDMCKFYHVAHFQYGTKEELGHAIGKELRASIAVIDAGFSKSLIRLLEESNI